MDPIAHGFAVIIRIVLFLMALAIAKAIVSGIKHRKLLNRRKREKDDFVAEVSKTGSISPLEQSPILLQKDELAIWSEKSTLFETRAVRRRQNGVSTSVQQWEPISDGTLVLTTKRLVFDGIEVNRTIPLGKVFSAKTSSDGDELHVASSSRQKEMAFSSRNSFLLSWLVNTLAAQ